LGASPEGVVSSVAANHVLTARSDRPVLPAKSDTLISVQVLRAVAALAVTIFHLRPYFGINFGIRDALPGFLSVGAAGVHMFFVISGFVIVYSSAKLLNRPDSSREFFVRRCIRIVPLYWGMSLILLWHGLLVHGTIASPRSIVASFAFIPTPRSNGLMYPLVVVGWTLNYEMFFYSVFALGLMFLRNLVVAGVSAFFVAIVVLSALAGPLPQPFAFWTSAIILEFVTGMLLAVAYRSGIALAGWGAGSLIFLGLIGLGLSSYDWHYVPRGMAWGAASTLIVAGAVLGPRLDASRIAWKPLNLLGDASYSLYLIHPFAFAVPRWCFPRLVDPIANPCTYASLIVLSAVLVAIAMHLLVEKPVTLALTRLWSSRMEPNMAANLMRPSSGVSALSSAPERAMRGLPSARGERHGDAHDAQRSGTDPACDK
jgi:exopolysaccharide production protein ExoZ